MSNVSHNADLVGRYVCPLHGDDCLGDPIHERRQPCPSSGMGAGETRNTKKGRQGWCSRCGKWRAITSTGKFKKHAPPNGSSGAEC